ncbi:DNA-binding transcriptional MocR family regulator [Neorhizobium galegae]|uniref:aminotransferase-like domain-containing protein n=1 Tax=Neorhizobium galegae TaxID=399 RepID=UPI001AE493DC|nr:PLP-dependent aminotransferase family protein [Neorhizobium galegae]MBP2562185.1 DNA-binding transcriptional MocR family regulator [Neorhizobium galegae]
MSKVSAYRLSRLLGNWSIGDGTLAERLKNALVDLINDNAMPIGSDLPSERPLAEALGTSRGTVTAAYASLREAALIESRHGSGHRILRSSAYLHVAERPNVSLRGHEGRPPSAIDMSSGALQPSPVAMEVVAGIQGKDLLPSVADVGYLSSGMPHLKWEVARYYSELGLPTHPDNIIITNGAQQAIWLLSSILVRPGDAVVVEDPTYRGALEAFRHQNARLISAPLGRDLRLDLSALETRLSRRPKVAYFFSDVSNPLGRTLSQDVRSAVSAMLQKNEVFLIEDGSQNELGLTAQLPNTPLAGSLDENRSALIGTMSKLFWGGLRIGWIRSGRGLIKTLTAFKAASDLGNPIMNQAIAARMFPHLAQARAHRRNELQHHLSKLRQELVQRPSRWCWIEPDGGTALWIKMPGVNTVSLRQSALRRNFLLSAGPDFSPENGFQDSLRLPFVRPIELLRSTLDMIEDVLQITHGSE